MITTDALIDGVHFLSEKMEAAAVGHRAIASNLSDIAAMGARPVLATIALGLPPSVDQGWVLECYRGMQALAARHGTRIVGGDVVRAPVTMLSVTVVGEVSPSRLKRRDGGRAGDVLAVTGSLGASRAGLELLRRSPDQFAAKIGAAEREAAVRAFARPEPRLAEGHWLAASRNVHAMMDCSDGLSLDVDRLARASACGAALRDVPIAPAAAAIASAAGDDPLRYALEGGEDFELVVAVAPRAFSYLARRFEKHFKRPLLDVGRLDSDPGLRIQDGGDVRALSPRGWDHLAGEG